MPDLRTISPLLTEVFVARAESRDELECPLVAGVPIRADTPSCVRSRFARRFMGPDGSWARFLHVGQHCRRRLSAAPGPRPERESARRFAVVQPAASEPAGPDYAG